MYVYFSGATAARRFVERVKRLPYVSYATAYTWNRNHAKVMVCGDLEGREEEIVKLKSIKNEKAEV